MCCEGVSGLEEEEVPALPDSRMSSMRSRSFSIFSALFSTCEGGGRHSGGG